MSLYGVPPAAGSFLLCRRPASPYGTGGASSPQIPGAPHPGTGLIMEVPPLEWKTVPGQELFIQFSIEPGAKLKLNKTVMFV